MIPRLEFGNPPTERIIAYTKALQEQGFAGDIDISNAMRLVMSTDNSVYQVLPEVVLFPRHLLDLQIIFKTAHIRNHKIHFTLRGGGTSTNGQSLGEGVIIDCSKYMTQIKEVNFIEEWVRVEAGVVLDQLNDYLQPHGYFFPITISPSSRCTLGGMTATNACGQGSSFYGRMLDHILELKSVLADGSILESQSLSIKEVEFICHHHDHIGNIYRQVKESIDAHKKEIKTLYPTLARPLTGYTLSQVYSEQHFNLNAILTGSEGTLAATGEIKLKISKIPSFRALVVIQYSEFQSALEDGILLIKAQPQSIETIDEKIINLAKTDILYPVIKSYLEQPNPLGGLTLVQFVGDSEKNVKEQVEKLHQLLKKHKLVTRLNYQIIYDKTVISALWELRKKSVGLLARTVGHRHPVSGVEDTLVPPEKLPDFIKEFRQILDQAGLEYGMFGHIDAGCLHVRPALDLSDPEDELLYYKISNAVAELVQKYDGIMWGEHGKGLRSQYVPDVFGEVLFKELCKIKKVFDPENILNPGKIAVPNGNRIELITIQAMRMRGYYNRQISAALATEFNKALLCNGNGACFDYDKFDTICPSYKVTRNRIHSPKGRASLIREWLRLLTLQNEVNPPKKRRATEDKYDFSHAVYNAMHGCLGCGACKTQCPVHVNVPSFKSRFLALYHSRYPRTLRDRVIANAETMGYWQAKAPRFFNFLLQNRLGRWLTRKILKLTELPNLSIPTFKHMAGKKNISIYPAKKIVKTKTTIVLLQDWVTTFYDAEVVTSFYFFLRRLGYDVRILQWFQNGKPFHVKGYREKFETLVQANTKLLAILERQEIPLLGVDPSITLTYRNEYSEWVTPPKVWLIQEWLAHEIIQPRILSSPQKTLILFMHCTEKTENATLKNQWMILFEKFGLKLIIVDVGCCGMAGTYGHEVEHAGNSKNLFNMSWQCYLHADNIILASGFSCRQQIRRLTTQTVWHPIEFLALKLAEADGDSTS